MDAISVLEQVASRYRSIDTLAVEALMTTESHMDGVYTRREEPVTAFFAAPNKIRTEHGGMVVVTDGVDWHFYFAHPRHYFRREVTAESVLPGAFRPESWSSNAAIFLFTRIAEGVASAELVKDEAAVPGGAPCHVLSVSYYHDQRNASVRSASPLLLWVDADTHLIRKLVSEAVFTPRQLDEVQNKMTLAVKRIRLDEELSPETFSYVPPPEAMDHSNSKDGRAGGSFANAGVSVRGARSGNSFEFTGDPLNQRFNVKLQGVGLAFDRKLTVSEDGMQVQITERITGPAGTEREFSVPLS